MGGDPGLPFGQTRRGGGQIRRGDGRFRRGGGFFFVLPLGVLRNRIDDLAALDEEVLNQFGLPLWPCLVASQENEIVTLQNNGVGVARSVSAAPSESLFSATEATSEVDLCPGKAIQLPVTGSPASVEVRFTKYGAERHVRVPIVVVTRPPGSGADLFDWATQAQVLRATQRVPPCS